MKSRAPEYELRLLTDVNFLLTTLPDRPVDAGETSAHRIDHQETLSHRSFPRAQAGDVDVGPSYRRWGHRRIDAGDIDARRG